MVFHVGDPHAPPSSWHQTHASIDATQSTLRQVGWRAGNEARWPWGAHPRSPVAWVRQRLITRAWPKKVTRSVYVTRARNLAACPRRHVVFILSFLEGVQTMLREADLADAEPAHCMARTLPCGR